MEVRRWKSEGKRGHGGTKTEVKRSEFWKKKIEKEDLKRKLYTLSYNNYFRSIIMELLKKIESEMMDATKKGEKLKADTLKMLKSDITYEKGKTGEDLSEDKILEIITRAGKRRKESIEEYRKADREDLASQEEMELKIIETYLPEMMSEEDVESFISEKIKEMGGASKKDFGRVMGQMMKDLKGKADGAVVKKVLSKKLTD